MFLIANNLTINGVIKSLSWRMHLWVCWWRWCPCRWRYPSAWPELVC